MQKGEGGRGNLWGRGFGSGQGQGHRPGPRDGSSPGGAVKYENGMPETRASKENVVAGVGAFEPHNSSSSSTTQHDAVASDFPISVFTLSTSSAMLSNAVVEAVGLERIVQLGQLSNVKVVKCIGPFQLLLPGDTSNSVTAIIGCAEGLREFERQIVGDIRRIREALNNRNSGVTFPYQLESHSTYRNHVQHGMPTHTLGTPTHHRVVTREPRCLERSQSLHELQVNEITMRYVNTFKIDDIRSIESTCQINVYWSTENGLARAAVTAATAHANTSEAKERLAAVCKDVSHSLDERRLPVPKDGRKAVKLDDFKQFRVLVSFEDMGNSEQCVIIGPKRNVIDAGTKIEQIFKQLHSSDQKSSSVVLRSRKITVKKGDLAKENVDAIVNAANARLGHYGGVAKCICDAGGKTIQEESDQIMKTKHLAAGDAVLTTSGKLPCKAVIHAIPPSWTDSNSLATLKTLNLACKNVLKIATEQNFKTLAIPGLGSGIYKIPKDQCALTLFNAVDEYFQQVPTSSVTAVCFINIDEETTKAFEKECERRVAEVSKSQMPSFGNYSCSSSETKTADCKICCHTPTAENPMTQLPCKHEMCSTCRKKLNKKPVCPYCQTSFGVITGNQPFESTMHYDVIDVSLPGFKSNKTIQIMYHVPDGIQTDEHPNPGTRFFGTSRRAYLPDSQEGREVLAMLKEAFDRRLIFTIGRSVTTGQDNVATWNDIHHKTNQIGGPDHFGYPDPTFLQRVKRELMSKGISAGTTL